MASGFGPVFLIAIDKSEASEEVFNCKSEHHHYTRPVADPGFPRRGGGGGRLQPLSLGGNLVFGKIVSENCHRCL